MVLEVSVPVYKITGNGSGFSLVNTGIFMYTYNLFTKLFFQNVKI